MRQEQMPTMNMRSIDLSEPGIAGLLLFEATCAEIFNSHFRLLA